MTDKNRERVDPGAMQTVRIPLYLDIQTQSGGLAFSSLLSGAGSFVYNGYTLENKRVKKRPALVKRVTDVPFTTAQTKYARGIYWWNNTLYSVYEGALYANGTLLSVTIADDSDHELVSFAETHPDAATQYLVINAKTACYLVDTSNNVLVMNNIAVTTSSVAASTVITTSTAHNLATGNRVIIRGHSGSTPALNDTIYTVTVLTSTTFSIPVTVTVAGTGGTLGVFPTNVGSLEFLDGYMFVGTVDGRIYNCSYNDPTTWPVASYITAQMSNDSLVGLAKQNNMIIALKERTMQFFYDAAKAPGTPLENVEANFQQVGCWGRQSIQSNTDVVIFCGGSKSGEFKFYMLEGASRLSVISTPSIETYFTTTPVIPSNFFIKASLFSFNGITFYTCDIPTISSGSVVFNKTTNMWHCWRNEDQTSNTGNWPISWTVIKDSIYSYLIGQDWYQGYIYTLTSTQGADNNSANNQMSVFIQTLPVDIDTYKRKFWERVELIIYNLYSASSLITVGYSDDIQDNAVSSPEISKTWTTSFTWLSNRFSKRGCGNSRQRVFGIKHVGADIGTEYEALELDVRISDM